MTDANDPLAVLAALVAAFDEIDVSDADWELIRPALADAHAALIIAGRMAEPAKAPS